MNWTNGIFCAGALAGSLLAAVVAYPFTAMSPEQLAFAEKPQPAEDLGAIDVGNGFGNVLVTALMDYYITNPPAAGALALPKIRFGGC
jgi:hypothetical protein